MWMLTITRMLPARAIISKANIDTLMPCSSAIFEALLDAAIKISAGAIFASMPYLGWRCQITLRAPLLADADEAHYKIAWKTPDARQHLRPAFDITHDIDLSFLLDKPAWAHNTLLLSGIIRERYSTLRYFYFPLALIPHSPQAARTLMLRHGPAADIYYLHGRKSHF